MTAKASSVARPLAMAMSDNTARVTRMACGGQYDIDTRRVGDIRTMHR